jgi:cyclopropane fatty-acyl-phospholipid synthase-like methyltransferase
MTIWDEVSARDWADQSVRVEDVDFPWHMAARLVRESRPGVQLILDAAAGPGGFLAAALDVFPEAQGVWLDSSPTMRAQATSALDRFGGRVRFGLGDMVTMPEVGNAGDFDLIVTSRATHHLTVPELTRFHQRCADLLSPTGWFANLDSMSESPQWRQRLRAVRSEYRAAAGRPEVTTHPHPNVAPRTSEHVASLTAAGFTEIEIVWRSFVTTLLMARKVDPADYVRISKSTPR